MTRPLRVTFASVAITAFALAAIALAAWLHVRGTDAEWERIRARGAAMAADALRSEQPHAPLRGESAAGEAASLYLRATKEHDRAQRELFEQRVNAAPAPCELTSLTEVAELSDGRELPADMAERLAPFAASLASLAAGAASERIHFGELWTPFEQIASDERGGVGVLLYSPIGKLALVAARHELACGRGENALQRTADALTLARDQMQSGIPLYELIGADTVRAGCVVWTDDALRRLTPPLLRDFAEVLRRFDEATPAVVQSTRSGCGMIAEGSFHDPARGDWRRLMSRLFRNPADRSPDPGEIGAYFDALDALPPATAPWSVREPALTAATALLPCLGFGPANVERERREALARERLLRMTIVHHLGEPVPPLPDPFGDGALRVADDGGGVRFASLGQSDGNTIERHVRN